MRVAVYKNLNKGCWSIAEATDEALAFIKQHMTAAKETKETTQ